MKKTVEDIAQKLDEVAKYFVESWARVRKRESQLNQQLEVHKKIVEIQGKIEQLERSAEELHQELIDLLKDKGEEKTE